MNGTETVIAGTAFEIVVRSLAKGEGSEANAFRLKNLTRSEALEFLRIWRSACSERGVGNVKVVIANDSHEDFPVKYRAEPGLSITHYRNNNKNGLVYIETKVESDEQGLKNIFTLRDVNFLDGTFDEPDEFLVADEIVNQAFIALGDVDLSGKTLIRGRIIEVLSGLGDDGTVVSVRKFAKFACAIATEWLNGEGVYESVEIDSMVGRSLVHLDMFPDEFWREDSGRVSRRLGLNLLRAAMAASSGADLDPDKFAEESLRKKFVDQEGARYDVTEEQSWRNECAEYCQDPSEGRRAKMPYRIFEQIFAKDVAGLRLGRRVAEEIADRAPARKAEFDALDIECGLDSKSSDDASRLIELDPEDPDVRPLRSFLSSRTLKMVEKLAVPSVELIENPLLKLAQVAVEFRGRQKFDERAYRIELRTGVEGKNTLGPSLGLLAFLYGRALHDIGEALADGVGNVALKVEECLVEQMKPPALESGDDDENQGQDGVDWAPVPLEFVLIDSDTGREIDSESSIQWLPHDWEYLALFWISVCGEDRVDISAELSLPQELGFEAWVSNVTRRVSPFHAGAAQPIPDESLQDAIIEQLIALRAAFRSEVEKNGLSSQHINDTWDKWSSLLEDARNTYIPEGEVSAEMLRFLNADCVINFGHHGVLMLQSHPLRLRWIGRYISKCEELAIQSIDGSLKLNQQNEDLYLNWIRELSPHQQPAIHTSADGKILFANGEKGWAELFKRDASSGGVSSGNSIDESLVAEVVRQITAYLHAHPYKADGLHLLVITGGASALPADIVKGIRTNEFKNLALTIDLVAPKHCWGDASRRFEMVETDNRLGGGGAILPPVQLNLHELDEVRKDAEAALKGLNCDIAIVPQFLDDNVSVDAKTQDRSSLIGQFDPLLDEATHIVSGSGASALWVSMRPKTTDIALSNWSTLVVRHNRKSAVSNDRPEGVDYIDLRIDFQNSARFYGALHKLSHWVITVERHITREQIEKLETRPDVLSLRDGVGPGGLFTVIVSSNAGKQFVIARLGRKLRRIASSINRDTLSAEQISNLAHQIYDEARQIAPRLTLDALGISRVTEEILGLSVARKVSEKLLPALPEDGFVAWISLDEHPEWFGSANAVRADMVRLVVSRADDGIAVDLLVLESKLRRAGFVPHGAEQVRHTVGLLEGAFPQDTVDEPVDGRLWREKLLEAVDILSAEAFKAFGEAVENQSSGRSRIPEDIRAKFRAGEFSNVKVNGLYSICEYSHAREMCSSEYDVDERVTVVQTGGAALLGGAPLGMSAPKTGGSDLSQPASEEGRGAGCPEEAVSAAMIDSGEESVGSDHSLEPICPQPRDQGLVKPSEDGRLGKTELDRRYQIVLDAFGHHGVNVQKAEASVACAIEGPASILFRVRPGKGVDPRKLFDKRDVLKLALGLESGQGLRFDIDSGYITIDVPKGDADRYFIDAVDMWKRWQRPEVGLKVPLGEDRFGEVVEIDFSSSNSPHLLIGGTTGSGKSEALNTILAGVIKHYSPREVRLQLIDPKGTELEHFADSEHLDGEIGWLAEDAVKILDRAVEEMQSRYSRFKAVRARSIDDFNRQSGGGDKIPRWLIVLDEYADLTTEPEEKKEIESRLRRLAQKARAAGIHVVIATQKPDATVISTNLRSNLPAQLALRVKSATESRVIMDDPGAEALTGKGDAMYKESGRITRVQCAKV